MEIKEIKQLLLQPEYDFLRTNPHLNKNIILLTLGGSYAYGINMESSDVDLRGCALNSKKEILLSQNFEQVLDETTDTTIYSFNKLIDLLSKCNPNTIELLGNKKEHYLYVSPIGQSILDNKDLFLSQLAINTFGGYASAQLRRLYNLNVRTVNQSEREQHILNSIHNAYSTFPDKYCEFDTDSIELFIDKSNQEDYDTEIFMNVNLSHYPLRDYKSMWSEMNNIVKDYSKIGKRNLQAKEHNKLGKHMGHLVRLYLMCFDILEKGEINTYREHDIELLMKLRTNQFLTTDSLPNQDFYELLNELEKRFEYAKKHTNLPKRPDYKKIEEFIIDVNNQVVNQ